MLVHEVLRAAEPFVSSSRVSLVGGTAKRMNMELRPLRGPSATVWSLVLRVIVGSEAESRRVLGRVMLLLLQDHILFFPLLGR